MEMIAVIPVGLGVLSSRNILACRLLWDAGETRISEKPESGGTRVQFVELIMPMYLLKDRSDCGIHNPVLVCVHPNIRINTGPRYLMMGKQI